MYMMLFCKNSLSYTSGGCRFALKLLSYILLFAVVTTSQTSAKSINLAVSNATTGPVSQLGSRLNQGAKAYFDHVNDNGGIHGQLINMIHLDDGYEPYKAYGNTMAFLARDDIFAFFNYVGTPTTYAVYSKVAASNIPFITPFTGAEFLRNPVTPNFFNLRASYYQEVEKQISYLVEQRHVSRIGLLVQADEFGASVEKGYLKSLKKRGIEPVVTTRYRRNSQDITLALSILKDKNVDAIAFVGTYEPLAELINLAFADNYKPIFSTVSFISSNDLFPRIKYPAEVLVTEVMEDPIRCLKEICQQFVRDMKAVGVSDIDRVQFEGYLNAFIFTEVASRCSTPLTQACMIEKLSQFQYQRKGLNVSFLQGNNQGMSKVYLNFYSTP